MKVNQIATYETNLKNKIQKTLFSKGGAALNISQISREIGKSPRTLSNQKKGERMKQADHLKVARAARDARDDLRGRAWNGRKSKAAAVQEWRQNNPEGRKVDCMKDTGLAKNTVYKHWQQDEPQKKRDLPTIHDVITFDVASIEELNEQIDTLQGFLDTLTAEEQREWYNENRQTVDELMSRLEEYTQDGNE